MGCVNFLFALTTPLSDQWFFDFVCIIFYNVFMEREKTESARWHPILFLPRPTAEPSASSPTLPQYGPLHAPPTHPWTAANLHALQPVVLPSGLVGQPTVTAWPPAPVGQSSAQQPAGKKSISCSLLCPVFRPFFFYGPMPRVTRIPEVTSSSCKRGQAHHLSPPKLIRAIGRCSRATTVMCMVPS